VESLFAALSSAGDEGRVLFPTSGWLAGCARCRSAGPQGLVMRTRRATRESSPVRWAASSGETPTYPCQASGWSSRTHTFATSLDDKHDNCPQMPSGENPGSRCGAMVSTTCDTWSQMSSQNQRVGGLIPSRRIKHASGACKMAVLLRGGTPPTFHPHLCPQVAHDRLSLLRDALGSVTASLRVCPETV
jgi:hypothetical protein